MATTVTDSSTWNIDTAHSSIDFSVKHMGIFTVRGTLGPVTGTAETANGELSSVNVSIDPGGINTNNAQRDEHLKSPDFLNVRDNPTIEFKSTSITKKSDTEFTLTGDLTLAGATRPLTVDLEVVAPVTDPWGGTRAGAAGSGVIKRSEWGLTYNSVMETGHMIISDDVKFTFDIQVVAAPALEA